MALNHVVGAGYVDQMVFFLSRLWKAWRPDWWKAGVDRCRLMGPSKGKIFFLSFMSSRFRVLGAL